MIRGVTLVLAGLVLGAIIHLSVILILPAVAERSVWDRIAALPAHESMALLETPEPGQPNPFGLDPGLMHAACRLDIADGPGAVRGRLPDSFWSVAVYEPRGTVIFATTNRSASGSELRLGLFNPAQTRLLAEQQLEVEEGLLIVETTGNEVLVVVRIRPNYRALRPRYGEALSALQCDVVR